MSRIKTFEWRVMELATDTRVLECDTEYLVHIEPTSDNLHYGQGKCHGACRLGPYYLYVDDDGTHLDSSGGRTFYGNWRVSHYVRVKDLAFTRVRP